MKTQVLHSVSCIISGEAAGEICNWSLLGVKRLILYARSLCITMRKAAISPSSWSGAFVSETTPADPSFGPDKGEANVIPPFLNNWIIYWIIEILASLQGVQTIAVLEACDENFENKKQEWVVYNEPRKTVCDMHVPGAYWLLDQRFGRTNANTFNNSFSNYHAHRLSASFLGKSAHAEKLGRVIKWPLLPRVSLTRSSSSRALLFKPLAESLLAGYFPIRWWTWHCGNTLF